jgi:hypothetical protein
MSPARKLRHAAVLLESEEVLLRRVVDAHGEATLGGLLTVMAVPCLLPSSGLGWVLSFGFFAVGIAMLMGSERVHLPRRVDSLPMKKRTAQKLLLWLARLYVRAGRLAKPRWTALTGRTAQRWLSLLVLAMGFIIFLPIPGGNTLPAISLILLGPALIFRDGLMVILSILAGVVAIIATAGAAYALFWAALYYLF